jgi:hypothetical protein
VRANASRARQHQLGVRIGLHWGAVLTDGVAVTGDAVHVAARVARAAAPGAVCLTREVFQELGPGLRLHCHPCGSQTLKGLPHPVELLELDWRNPEDFPRRVRIDEMAVEIDLPQQDIVSFGRLLEHEGARANDVVLHHPDPERQRQISRWHFELRRVVDGLRLRALSDAVTTVDGRRVERGAEVPVRGGSCIGVAGVLTLTLAGPARPADDEASGRTTLVTPPRAPG